jgi:hypothetical protein
VFPEREQRNHIDIYAGMMFYFVPTWAAFEPEFRKTWVESNIAWTIIHKELIGPNEGLVIGTRYLLLGNGRLVWHVGHLGWIRRVADPVWEERYEEDKKLAPRDKRYLMLNRR